MFRTPLTPQWTFFILVAVCVCFFTALDLLSATPLIGTLDKLDKAVMQALNFDGGFALDQFWFAVSAKTVWIPIAAALLISFSYGKQDVLIPVFIVVGLALTVTLADQISSSLIKPYFTRFRPSHNEEICDLLHYVNNYKSGKYGFVSSHAANAFGVLAFLAPFMRHKISVVVLAVWTCMVSYSRIYLGVHYPGDIIGGALVGFTSGLGVQIAMQWLYMKVRSKCNKQSATNGLTQSFNSNYITTAIIGTAVYILLYSFGQSTMLTNITSAYITMLY